MQMFHQSDGYELRFRDIVYKIDKKEILKSVSGNALPGEMLAVMGPSGRCDCTADFGKVWFKCRC